MGGVVASAPVKPTPTVDSLVLSDVFRIAFEHSAAGISVATPSGEYLHANRAFCEFVGYSLDELRGMNLMDLVHPEDRRRTAELSERMQTGHLAEARWERRYMHK